jgi:tetratricopeptide (TPR) repeat protein/S1-C subfamily serine protease
MKQSIYVTLITCSSLLLIPAVISQSQTTNHNQSVLATEEVSTESIQQTAFAITVKTIVGSDDDSTSASGVLIAKSGNIYTVVTNAHVIGDEKYSFKIKTFDGKTHSAVLTNIKSNKSGQKDLALLQFKATEKYTPASLGDLKQVTPEQPVFASGFADDEAELRFNSGKIGQISQKPLMGGYQIGFTNSTKQGMSGGALLNEEGKVIGILGLGAGAILDNAYLYADNSRPDAQMLEKLRDNSFAVPVTQIASSIASKQEKETQETDSKITPSKKYTGLPGKIDNIAQQITVRIDSQNNGNGSGVIVAHEGNSYYVATAGHVVENQDDYTIVTPDGQSYSIENSTIKIFEGLDLAVVQFQSQEAYSVATLGKYNLNYDSNKEVRWVFVSGFPGKKIETEGQPPRLLTAGIVQPKDTADFETKDSYSLKDGYGLLYTNQSFPGMSGGAVLDSQGRVMGINTGAEDEIVISKTGEVTDISLGYSLGVPIGSLIGLAKSAKIQPEWLKQQTSKPSVLSSTDRDSTEIRVQMFDEKEPSSNATEVYWLNYGNQLWRFSKSDEATIAFDRAIQLNPNSHYAYYGKGLALKEQYEEQQAKNAFQQATKLNSSFYPAWREMGDMLNELEQYPEAIKAYSKAIQLQPQDFVPYVERGGVYSEIEHYQEALADFKEAMRIQPHPRSYSGRGDVYEKLENYQAALAEHNQAIQINPNNADNYNNRGDVYEKLENYQAALADYNKVIELEPDNAFSYKYRGDFYKKTKDYPSALADYNKAIQIDPDYGYHYKYRGDFYKEIKNYQAALSDYNKAIAIEPNDATDATNYKYRGDVYRELENYQAALADYTKAIEINPNDADNYQTRGNFYKKLKDYQAALADYTKAIEINPNNDAGNYRNRGGVHEELEDYQAALADYTKAIEIEPDDTFNYQTRGGVYEELENYQAALADYTKAIEIEPDDAFNYRNRGGVHKELEDYQAALADYTKAIEIEPDDAFNYRNRGGVHKELENYQAALTDYTKAIEIEPDDGSNYQNRGGVYKELENYQAALTDYTKAIEIEPDDAYAYYFRGNLYEKLNDYQAALADYSKAIQIDPDNTYNYQGRGHVYEKLNDYQAAITDYQKAAQLYQQEGDTEGYQRMQEALKELQ